MEKKKKKNIFSKDEKEKIIIIETNEKLKKLNLIKEE